VRNSLPVVRARKDVQPTSRERWPVASAGASVIDTSLVRAELARLRGLRPATEIHRARSRGSTISAKA